MATWDEILESIQPLTALENKKNTFFKDYVKYTKRNVIVYFSFWQQKASLNPRANFSIDDDDKNGFMNAIHKMDKEKGLDLIIHTPGGDIFATQSIVDYLHQIFNGNIRVIVPNTAMSAGTMIACSAKEIILAKHSNLGPIDPQIQGVPAFEYLKMIEKAFAEVSSGVNISYWSGVLAKYPPTFFGECQNAIECSNRMVCSWLERNMLKGDNASSKQTVDYLSDYNTHLIHGTRFDFNVLSNKTSLKISRLEDDAKLQDLVLSLYHSYIIYASQTAVSKIIENDKGKKYIKNI